LNRAHKALERRLSQFRLVKQSVVKQGKVREQ